MNKPACRFDLDGRSKSFEFPDNLSLSLTFIAVNSKLVYSSAPHLYSFPAEVYHLHGTEREESPCLLPTSQIFLEYGWKFVWCLPLLMITDHFHPTVILDFLLSVGWMVLGLHTVSCRSNNLSCCLSSCFHSPSASFMSE